MKSSLTILVSSAGRRVELLNCFREDARSLGLDLRVLATDCNPALSAACHAADHAIAVPRCSEPIFIDQMLRICEEQRVDLVIPTIDTELIPLAEARTKFEELGTRVAVSDLATVSLARDKLVTSEFLETHRISAPRSLSFAHLIVQPDALRFPVILKPRGGSCSIGLKEIASADEIAGLSIDPASYIAQEKWIGREYTVNMFFDGNGRCCASVPHLRREVRGGEVSKGTTERHPLLEGLAARLATALPGARGALCFQAIIEDDGAGVVFEINARFGGGYPLAHRAGAHFSRWLLEEAAGLPCTANNDWRAGLTMLRYDAAIFTAVDS